MSVADRFERVKSQMTQLRRTEMGAPNLPQWEADIVPALQQLFSVIEAVKEFKGEPNPATEEFNALIKEYSELPRGSPDRLKLTPFIDSKKEARKKDFSLATVILSIPIRRNGSGPIARKSLNDVWRSLIFEGLQFY